MRVWWSRKDGDATGQLLLIGFAEAVGTRHGSVTPERHHSVVDITFEVARELEVAENESDLCLCKQTQKRKNVVWLSRETV